MPPNQPDHPEGAHVRLHSTLTPVERELITLNDALEASSARRRPDDGTPAIGQVLVKSASAEIGDNVGQLEASVRGVQIAFNGRYLRDALEAVDSPQVSLQLSSAGRPG